MTKADEKRVFVQGTVVAAANRGLLIIGPSGSGKSALALDLIALGAGLVADDGVWISAGVGGLLATTTTPSADTALIEARGIGILTMPAHQAVRLHLVVDLGQGTSDRLPNPQVWAALGSTIPRLPCPARGFHPAALLAALRHGPPRDPDQPMLAQPPDSDEAAALQW